jgi:N-methylhydantoinase A/oxoprolinase/acetone carboxylase beta subunit
MFKTPEEIIEDKCSFCTNYCESCVENLRIKNALEDLIKINENEYIRLYFVGSNNKPHYEIYFFANISRSFSKLEKKYYKTFSEEKKKRINEIKTNTILITHLREQRNKKKEQGYNYKKIPINTIKFE